MTAWVSLGAFKLLAKDDIQGAKAYLARHVGSYYQVYHASGGDIQVLSAIEEAAQQYPAISGEISETEETNSPTGGSEQ
jgi:hypothetical protein